MIDFSLSNAPSSSKLWIVIYDEKKRKKKLQGYHENNTRLKWPKVKNDFKKYI